MSFDRSCLFVIIILLFITSIPFTRAEQSNDELFGHTFHYADQSADVFFIDHRSDIYTENSWFDIKSITSESSIDRIWVNMTMYDKVQDDEKIYYKLKVADAEVIMYQGLGQIIYQTGFEDTVFYSGYTISANLHKEKLTFETFKISGSAYREDQNESYGDYIIIDEVGIGKTNPENSLELNYIDSKDDVKISYIYSTELDTIPELDIQTIELIDYNTKLCFIIHFGDYLISSNDIKYIITLGSAKIEYSDGDAYVKYKNSQMETPVFEVNDRELLVYFDYSMLVFQSNKFEVTTLWDADENTTYRDGFSADLPKYMYLTGEPLDLDIILFQNNKIIMDLYGELNVTHTSAVRQVIDAMGVENGIVEQSEYETFLTKLKQDFSIEEFFEFYPTFDSKTGINTLDFEFENVLGNVSEPTKVFMSIKANFEFSEITQNYHNITLNLYSHDQIALVGNVFIFDFIYNDIRFNFTDEYQYWEFVPTQVFPKILSQHIIDSQQKLELTLFDYEMLKNRIETQQKFGFYINYNQTAAELDSKMDDDSKSDDGSGFLPGFSTGFLIVGIILTCGVFVKLRILYQE